MHQPLISTGFIQIGTALQTYDEMLRLTKRRTAQLTRRKTLLHPEFDAAKYSIPMVTSEIEHQRSTLFDAAEKALMQTPFWDWVTQTQGITTDRVIKVLTHIGDPYLHTENGSPTVRTFGQLCKELRLHKKLPAMEKRNGTSSTSTKRIDPYHPKAKIQREGQMSHPAKTVLLDFALGKEIQARNVCNIDVYINTFREVCGRTQDATQAMHTITRTVLHDIYTVAQDYHTGQSRWDAAAETGSDQQSAALVAA